MDCRPGCGACCIAPSISSPLPLRPQGKPAGEPCPHLDAGMRCRLFGLPERPAVCVSLQATVEMCGTSRDGALQGLARLEADTRPDCPPALKPCPGLAWRGAQR
jgi:Fe-S-cluster containining protein